MGNPSLNHRYRKGFYSLFKTLQQNRFKQGTLSSWVAREKTVATLPIEFLHALSLACGETMDQVYDCLCVLEQEYIEFKKDNKSKKRKKYIQK
ncbi:hypothetical protein SKA88_15850 [Enterococcus faecium]